MISRSRNGRKHAYARTHGRSFSRQNRSGGPTRCGRSRGGGRARTRNNINIDEPYRKNTLARRGTEARGLGRTRIRRGRREEGAGKRPRRGEEKAISPRRSRRTGGRAGGRARLGRSLSTLGLTCVIIINTSRAIPVWFGAFGLITFRGGDGHVTMAKRGRSRYASD